MYKRQAWNPKTPDRQLVFSFHRHVPGLLLAMEYRRDGERQSHLTLTRVDLPDAPPGNQHR